MNQIDTHIKYGRFLFLGTISFGVAILALLIDIQVAHSCRTDSILPGDLKAVIRLSEAFAHSAGVTLIILCIWVTLEVDRRKVIRLIACAAVPGITANILKVCIVRFRPKSHEVFPETAMETFGSFFPLMQNVENVNLFQHKFQSFPSGHSATAVGLAIGLSWLFPRGKWCFTLLALLAMSQRVVSEAHFVSDTFAGAAIAFLIAGRYVSNHWEGRLFTHFENKKRNANNKRDIA